ncbi:MAG: toll/interleukin-1 receptor domain-containing protein [Phycisphaerales bacterium]|nr:toll/interleukin-1 receptor domain-containing protein [Hyphomonadaceae bacterium]
MTDRYRYAAFISYSSKDAAIAKRIHRALENYRIPRALGAFKITDAARSENRIFPCFRDREELPSGDLGAEIERALENASALVVICSPNSAQSQWVNAEIESFQRKGRSDRIFAVIVDGLTQSDAGVSDETLCFAPAFRKAGGPVVVAGDMRADKDGFRNAFIKVVAGIIGVNLGKLIDRDQAARRQRAVSTAIPIAAFAIAATWAPFAFEAYSQNVALSQEAVRRAESGDETASVLAYAALSPPRPYFFVNNESARAVIAQWGDDRQISHEELAAAAPITWPDYGGCPENLGEEYYSCHASRDDGARVTVLISARDHTLRLVEWRAQRARVLLSVPAADLQEEARTSEPVATLARSASSGAEPSTRIPQNAFADLFSSGVETSRRPEARVSVPPIYGPAWGDSAEIIAWSASGRVFWIEVRGGTHVMRSVQAPSSVIEIIWLETSKWLLTGREGAYLLDTSGPEPIVAPLPQEWLRTPVGIGFSRKHGTGVVPHEEGSTSVFRWRDGQFDQIGEAELAGAGVRVSYDEDWFGVYAFGRLLVLSAEDARTALDTRIAGSPGSLIGFVEIDGRPMLWVSDIARGGGGVYALEPPVSDAQIRARVCSALSRDPERRQEQLRSIVRAIDDHAPLYAAARTICPTQTE